MMYVQLIVLASALSLASCRSTNPQRWWERFPPKIEFQNWETEKHTFPPGAYYRFVGEILHTDSGTVYKRSQPYSCELMLGYLLGAGIDIREAWYRGPESNCHGFQVMVDASLLIRLDHTTDQEKLERLGFETVRSNDPGPGQCPYNVLHYIFKPLR